MEKYVIRGGKPLVGDVNIGGAKNAAVAILPATILAGGKCLIENLPCISDVMASLQILSELGANIRMVSRSSYEIDTTHLECTEVSNELSRQMRASYYFLGALLGRFGSGQVAMPGGCNLGPRPIDQHLKAFTAFGAEDSVEYGQIHVKAEHLAGAHVFFDTVSVGATMNAMLAAVLADEKVQSFLILMVTIPMWINMLLRTYAWMNILSDNGLVNNLLKMLGISPITMMYTDFSVIVGLVCNFMPFMIIPIHTSLSKMDKSLIEAANDLGANPFQTFWRITWKLSMPGVVNGIMMVFLLSISTFVIPKLLGGGQYMLIGNLIESQFISVGDWNFGSAISLILAVIILIFMSLMKKMDTQDD